MRVRRAGSAHQPGSTPRHASGATTAGGTVAVRSADSSHHADRIIRIGAPGSRTPPAARAAASGKPAQQGALGRHIDRPLHATADSHLAVLARGLSQPQPVFSGHAGSHARFQQRSDPQGPRGGAAPLDGCDDDSSDSDDDEEVGARTTLERLSIASNAALIAPKARDASGKRRRTMWQKITKREAVYKMAG